MPRVRDEAGFDEMQVNIKALARQQMAEGGTASISLRGIARALDLTAPALYRYYPSAEDLITALIVDGFNGLADTLEAAEAESEGQPLQTRLMSVLMAYRAWALAHPTDFQLIYGNPIPGYVAPADVTVPAVVRTFIPSVRLVELALRSGVLRPQAPYDRIPPQIEAHEAALIAHAGYPIQTLSYHLVMILWSQMHGIIMLELYHHIGPNVADVEAFYCTTLHNLLAAMGLSP
jgi:AcrR family transcriptional regulator